MIKIVRAAAPALDRAFAALSAAGQYKAASTTHIEFRDLSVVVTPVREHRDAVLSVMADEFQAEGWGFSTQFDADSPYDPDSLSDRKSLTFLHPLSLARIGRRPERPDTFRLDIPAPDPSLHITAELVERVTAEVRAVVLDTFRTQAMAEDGPNVDRALWGSEETAVEENSDAG